MSRAIADRLRHDPTMAIAAIVFPSHNFHAAPLTGPSTPRKRTAVAQVAELVDAPASGAGARKGVEVRVLSWAPQPLFGVVRSEDQLYQWHVTPMCYTSVLHMAFRMSRPFKRPNSNNFQFRMRVPKDLIELVGRREVTYSLRTSDVAEAKVAWAAQLQTTHSEWAALRRTRQSGLSAATGETKELTDREADQIASELYAPFVRRHLDNPSDQISWHPELFDRFWTEKKPGSRQAGVYHADELICEFMREDVKRAADELLLARDFKLDEFNTDKVRRAVAKVYQRAALRLEALDIGHAIFEEIDNELAQISQAASVSQSNKIKTSPLSFRHLFSEWWKAAKKLNTAKSTYQNYKSVVESFIRFIESDNIRDVSPDTVRSYRDFRLGSINPKTLKNISPKTVKDVDLAALRSIFGYAVEIGEFTTNPAAGLAVSIPKTIQLRSKGFMEWEAKALLKAALQPGSAADHPKTAAAKKWVPWLCAFTGARVGEMAQLRVEDVSFDGDIIVLNINPEAGRVKTKTSRIVVVHPQIIGLGFRSFVKSSS